MIEARTWANETASAAAPKRKIDTRSAAERAAELKSLKESFAVKS